MARNGWSGPKTDANGGVPVNVRNTNETPLDLKFQDSTNVTTLSADANIGDTTITLSSTTGFTAGKNLSIFSLTEGGYFGAQVGAPAGNVITLDTPIDIKKSSGSLAVSLLHNMNVSGSLGTPVIFQIGPPGSIIDITRITGIFQDGTAMDDAKFGGITALTNGIVLRRNNGIIENIFNAKSNSDLISLACGSFNYSEKAPGGSFGANFCLEYSGQSKHGTVIRLGALDTLELLIQDDLTGLEIFKMGAQGHFTTFGENGD